MAPRPTRHPEAVRTPKGRRPLPKEPPTVNMGETEEEAVAAVAAQVMMMVIGMHPGQTITVDRTDIPSELFRVRRTATPDYEG